MCLCPKQICQPLMSPTCTIYMRNCVYIKISIHIHTILGNVDISEFPDILLCDKHTIEKHNKTRRCPISEFAAHIGFILLFVLPLKNADVPLRVNADSWSLIYPNDFLHELTRTGTNSCQLIYEFVYEVSMTLSWGLSSWLVVAWIGVHHRSFGDGSKPIMYYHLPSGNIT